MAELPRFLGVWFNWRMWLTPIILALFSGLPACVPLSALPDDRRPTEGSTIIEDSAADQQEGGPSSNDNQSAPSDQAATGGVSPAEAESTTAGFVVRATPVFCCNPLSVDFEAVAAAPAKLVGARVFWSFGDGRAEEGIAVSHTFSSIGDYLVGAEVAWSDGVRERVKTQVRLAPGSDGSITLYVDGSTPQESGAGDGSSSGSSLRVDAGLTRSAATGESVVLHGTSYPADATLHYHWQKLAGPSVQMSGAETSDMSFPAPEVPADGAVLRFQLSVTSGSATASDTVTVIVNPASSSPAVPAEAELIAFDQSVTTKTSTPVVIRLSAEQTPGDEPSFRVKQSPAHGQLGEIASYPGFFATVTYFPATDYSGSDSFTYVVAQGEKESQPAMVEIAVLVPGPVTQPPAGAAGELYWPWEVKLVPWFELNYLEDWRKDMCVHGMQEWSRVTDTVIISTIQGRSYIYQELRERVPNIRIIPGMKTKELLDRFDSLQGWQRVAEEVSAVLEATGEHTLLLENESAMRPYIEGEYEIDPAQLRVALAQLPDGIEYLWYPALHGTAEQQPRYLALCDAMRAVHDVRFLDQSMCGRDTDPEWGRQVREKILGISVHTPAPLILFYGPGTTWWMDSQIVEVLNIIDATWDSDVMAILHSGQEYWPVAAEHISNILEEYHP